MNNDMKLAVAQTWAASLGVPLTIIAVMAGVIFFLWGEFKTHKHRKWVVPSASLAVLVVGGAFVLVIAKMMFPSLDPAPASEKSPVVPTPGLTDPPLPPAAPLSPNSDASPNKQPPGAIGSDSSVTVIRETPLREAPDRGAEVIGTIRVGDPLKLVQGTTMGNFIRVQSQTKTGWVFLSDVLPVKH